MKHVPTPERSAVTSLRAAGRTSVLIVGGGINGIATFRDLAMQGVDVVLVERSDFASGATAASSHMIHGGVRYLENGEFRLVRESVQERNSLLKIAPHFVRPLQTTIPIFSTFSGILSAPLRFLRHGSGRPQERGAALIKIGMMIYDLFSRDGGSVPRHRFLGRDASRAAFPELDPRVKYTASYYDASVHDPERLALDVLLDGLAANKRAHAVNYVEAIGMEANGVRLRDQETGEEFTVAADVVVNASGPWTDLTNGAFGRSTELMGGTKGSHIVLDNPELLAATHGNEIFFEHSDGRIVLIYPLKGRVLVGTTDIEADPRERAVCTEEEVDYFFDLIGHVFPGVAVDRSDIVFRYSGIRPLPNHGDLAPGFVSRDYHVALDQAENRPPVLSLVGGKWTTFRALGAELADRALEVIDRPRSGSTVGVPIGGGADYPASPEARREWLSRNLPRLDSVRRELLFERYGTRAAAVAAFMDAGTDSLLVGGVLSTRELEYLVRREHVVHLTDVVLRRTSLAFTGGATAAVLDELGRALAPILGWDDFALDHEIEQCAAELERYHGVAVHAATAP